jgi:hypothetical protein
MAAAERKVDTLRRRGVSPIILKPPQYARTGAFPHNAPLAPPLLERAWPCQSRQGQGRSSRVRRTHGYTPTLVIADGDPVKSLPALTGRLNIAEGSEVAPFGDNIGREGTIMFGELAHDDPVLLRILSFCAVVNSSPQQLVKEIVTCWFGSSRKEKNRLKPKLPDGDSGGSAIIQLQISAGDHRLRALAQGSGKKEL